MTLSLLNNDDDMSKCSCALCILFVVDSFFFATTALVCDAVDARLSASVIVAYALGACIFIARTFHYYSYYRTATLYHGVERRSRWMPAPTSDLQPLLAAALYSVLIALFALGSIDTRIHEKAEFVLFVIAYVTATLANMTYALCTDDRRELRRLIAEHIRKSTPADPSTQYDTVPRPEPSDTFTTWHGVISQPPTAPAQTLREIHVSKAVSETTSDEEEVSWASVSLNAGALPDSGGGDDSSDHTNSGRTDVTEALFDDLPQSKQERIRTAIKRR